jgi:hypothetical protein
LVIVEERFLRVEPWLRVLVYVITISLCADNPYYITKMPNIQELWLIRDRFMSVLSGHFWLDLTQLFER